MSAPAGDWTILYQRPDGWWVAGRGFSTRKEATVCAARQLPSSKPWTGRERFWRIERWEKALTMTCEDGYTDAREQEQAEWDAAPLASTESAGAASASSLGGQDG